MFLWWCSTWDLSSPDRDRTCAPCIGSVESYCWTAAEVPGDDVLHGEGGCQVRRIPWPSPPCPRQFSHQMVFIAEVCWQQHALPPHNHSLPRLLAPCRVSSGRCCCWRARVRIRQAQPLASTAWGCVTLGKELNLSEPETTVVAERLLGRVPVGVTSPLLSFLSHHPTVME